MRSHELFSLAIIVTLAVFGAIVRELKDHNKRQLVVLDFVIGAVVAGFLGLVVHFIAQWLDLNPNLAAAAGAIVGYIGYPILDTAAKVIRTKVESYGKKG